MSYEKVTQATSKKIIGTKQVLKAIKNGQAHEVIIASNADLQITDKIYQSAKEHQIPFYYVDSREELGKACGIDVSAAAVAIKH